jgi:hypothetical protein
MWRRLIHFADYRDDANAPSLYDNRLGVHVFISYRKTKHTERVAGFDQAPDFIVPDEVNPHVVIEAKITEDNGTARDKVRRVQHLGALSTLGRAPSEPPKFEVVACIAGRGFKVRREDMKMQPPRDAPAYLSEGQTQGIINPRPEEGPHKRVLRQRFESLAEAERAEAERKAAKAVPLNQPSPPEMGGEGDVSPPRDICMKGREPRPDYAIWTRGQRAAP